METKSLLLDMKESDKAILLEILDRLVSAGLEVWAFGSRARWTARETSDLDLVLRNPTQLETLIDTRILDNLKEAFEESDLPFMVDLLDWASVSEKFRKVIEREYVVMRMGRDGEIRKGWKKYKLGDLIDIKHGYAFKGEFFSDQPTADILLTPGNFKIGGGFKNEKFKYYKGEYPEDYILKAGDIVVTMTDLSKEGDTLGYSALVPNDAPNRFLHNQRIGLVQFKTEDCDKHFLYWLLRTKTYQTFIVNSATGSTVKHTSPTRIQEYEFQAPDLHSQRRIAAILSALDDKIEMNRQTNQTLEAIAQTLFKKWFVNFNFPGATGEMQDSEQGPIPVGWNVAPFADTIEIYGGGTPKTSIKEYWDGEIPWFSVADAPREADVWVLNTEKKISLSGVESSSTRLLPQGTTIISARGTVGRIALTGVTMAMNQSCYGLRGKYDELGFFTYYTTSALVTELQQRTHGSVFDTITRDTLQGVLVVMPPADLIRSFEESVKAVLFHIRENLIESQTLSTTRDALLPKLMSGEIAV